MYCINFNQTVSKKNWILLTTSAYRPEPPEIIRHFTMASASLRSVPFHHEERQWDARFNVQQDEDLNRLLEGIRSDADKGKFKYILVGGPEIGTRAYQDDYQIRHVHVAAIFHNRVSKRSILKNWNVKEGNGYYLVPRSRDLPYSGWRNHHIKDFSKIDKNKCNLYEMGTLPEDQKKTRVQPSDEEKKRKVDEVLIDMREMLENDQDEEAFRKYPRNFIQYGEKLKAIISQKRSKLTSEGHPHIWLFGNAGIGKSAILNYIYPQYFKKNFCTAWKSLQNIAVENKLGLWADPMPVQPWVWRKHK